MDSNFDQVVKKMIETFTKAEQKNKEKDEKYLKWIDKITNKESNLIPNLLTYFLDELTNQETRENIFKIFRKLHFLKRNIVEPQLLENKDFPKAIVSYITKEDKKKMSDNPFYLLTQLYNEENFKDMIDEKFIVSLFDGLSVVHDEELLNSIVSILIQINFNFKNNDDNLFFKIHSNNDNSRVLNEILLRLLNQENENLKKIQILTCLNNLMSINEKPLFYESDLESFIDILITKLNSEFDEQVKILLLSSLDKVTKYKEYGNNSYKSEDLLELIEGFQNSENNEIQNLSKQIIENRKNIDELINERFSLKEQIKFNNRNTIIQEKEYEKIKREKYENEYKNTLNELNTLKNNFSKLKKEYELNKKEYIENESNLNKIGEYINKNLN